MILVDSSVLINFFSGKTNKQSILFEELLISNLEFGICPEIYQELLQGAKSNREFKQLNDYLSTQTIYTLQSGLFSRLQAAELYRKCMKNGITIRSTIDMIIAETAIENNLYLLHDDRDFTLMAKTIPELKIYKGFDNN
ncbi:MAG: PIN domain-containing protein [Candidatus Marinimicrobia bacterium]|nr:PIN domain-containing protein [Candidatus Neomarinimicrobiota bacterium]